MGNKGNFLGVKSAANNIYSSPPTANKVHMPVQENSLKVISSAVIGSKIPRIRPPVLLKIAVVRWNGMSNNAWIILTGENCSTVEKNHPTATLIATKHRWIGREERPGLHGKKPNNMALMHGFAPLYVLSRLGVLRIKFLSHGKHTASSSTQTDNYSLGKLQIGLPDVRIVLSR